MIPDRPPLAHGAFEAVLFDMDGVIIDSEPVSARAMQEAARRFGFDVPDDAMASFKGLPGKVVYSRVAREYGPGSVDAVDLRRVRDDLYETWLPAIPLMAGILSLLETLCGMQKTLVLVTSSRRRHAQTVLERHGLGDQFVAIVGGEDVSNPKPAPDPYRIAAGLAGVAPERCVAIEDSVNGVRSASTAGCRVIGFGKEFTAEELLAVGAEIFCLDHAQTARALGISE